MSRTLPSGSRSLLKLAIPVALIGVGMLVRAPLPWTAAPFDVDEALYATFARQISHENDPFLLSLPVDKPPLAFFITALSFKVFTNPAEWAARLPAFYANILGLAALWALSLRLYHSWRTAALAVFIVALSPLDVALAGSVFVDPLLALFTLLACMAATGGRPGYAAVFAALAFATKQSAIQIFPLIIILGLLAAPHRQTLPGIALLTLLALFIAILPFAWDAARLPDGGWWALGLVNNAPRGFIRADEAFPRLLIWLNHLNRALGGPLVLTITGVGYALLLPHALRNRRKQTAALDLTLMLYSAGWLLGYWLLAFNTYDRYIHPIIPLTALLTARSIEILSGYLRRFRLGRVAWLPALLVVASLIGTPRTSPALEEARARHRGIVEVAAFLNTLPPGTIVYDRWVGWLLWWYTGQQRPPDMWLRLTYYPTPEALITDALRQPDPMPRYFVAPVWALSTPWLAALAEAGLSPEVALQQGQFAVFRLLPP